MSNYDPLLIPTAALARDNPFGPKLQRYWDQRHFLFSRFDEGIQIDEEGLYSVKPEEPALDIGRRTYGKIVLDAFCGVAGSAIGFARAGKVVIATDIDCRRLSMSAHNAGIYGLQDKIVFIQKNAMEAIETLEYETVYLDPPWGGPEYINRDFFSFEYFDPNPMPLIQSALRRGRRVVFTMPLNFDFRELAALHVDHYILWSHFKCKPIFTTAFIDY